LYGNDQQLWLFRSGAGFALSLMPRRRSTGLADTESSFKDHATMLRSRRTRRLAFLVFALYIFGVVSFYLFHDSLLLAHFKARNWAFDHGWRRCQLRKRPSVFVRGADEAAIVWETNCPFNSMGLSLQESTSNDMSEPSLVPVDRHDDYSANSRFVYRAELHGLDSARAYSYQVFYHASANSPRRIVLSKDTFVWIASTSGALPTSTHLVSPRIFHIAALADNQFGLKIFQRIVKRVSSIRRLAPSHLSRSGLREHLGLATSTRSLPDLVLHAGDAVQSVSNLQQWQTDFHDPLFYHSSLGSRVPLLYTPGNHDYDPKGAYIYTGGTARQTWRSLSIGRTRWVMLDSNVDQGPGDAQERWLREELEGPAWREASLRIVVVHVPPFLEYWEKDVWISGQNKW
jgi:hypothetical protein